MNASQNSPPIAYNHSLHEVSLPQQRIVHRSLPPGETSSRISVNQAISIMNPSDIRVDRFQTNETKKNQYSPHQGAALYKFVGGKHNKRSNGASNSNSRSRFDFAGPYA